MHDASAFKLKRNFMFTLIAVMGISLSLHLPDALSGEIVGDIDNNGVVDLREAVHALQVTAGMPTSLLLDSEYGPHRDAWGTYTYSGGVIDISIEISTFRSLGSETGDTAQIPVNSITATEMTVGTSPDTETWTRVSGTPGDVEGKWYSTDPAGNSHIVILDSAGVFYHRASGPHYTDLVQVPVSTKTIDGSFSDWVGSETLTTFHSRGNCPSGDGTRVSSVAVTQDDEYIYAKISLNGPYDSAYRYTIGQALYIEFDPPPGETCRITSHAGGDVAGVGNFGEGISTGHPTDTRYLAECRVPKCHLASWHPWWGFIAGSGTSFEPTCYYYSDLPMLVFDFSSCY